MAATLGAGKAAPPMRDSTHFFSYDVFWTGQAACKISSSAKFGARLQTRCIYFGVYGCVDIATHELELPCRTSELCINTNKQASMRPKLDRFGSTCIENSRYCRDAERDVCAVPPPMTVYLDTWMSSVCRLGSSVPTICWRNPANPHTLEAIGFAG
jgi:hypothetical protein